MRYSGQGRKYTGSGKLGFLGVVALALALTACADAPDKKVKQSVVDDTVRRAALEAEANRNYVAAVSHYQKLWSADTQNETLFLGIVRNLRYLGSAKDALTALQRNQDLFGEKPAYQLEYGKSLIAAERSRESIQHLTKAIALEPENWQIYSTLGIAYDRLEMFREARDAYELALDISPNNAKILNNLAISTAMGGDIRGAIETMNKAARADRNNVQIRQNLALFLGINGDDVNAEALARMDLDEDSVRNNLSVFKSLRTK